MVQFSNVVEVDTMLDYGKHLVKIVDVRNKTKDGDELLDAEGVEMWSITFQDVNKAKYYEYFRFTGKMANKTGYLLRACGVLDTDEKIAESKKSFSPEDILGKFLFIEIVENKNATEEKYRKTIKFDGFEKYESKSPIQPKVVEEKKVKTVKKAEPKVEEVVVGDEDSEIIPF